MAAEPLISEATGPAPLLGVELAEEVALGEAVLTAEALEAKLAPHLLVRPWPMLDDAMLELALTACS